MKKEELNKLIKENETIGREIQRVTPIKGAHFMSCSTPTNEAMKQFEEALKKMKEELGISSIHVVQNGEEPKEIK